MGAAHDPYGARLEKAMERAGENVTSLARKMALELGTKMESERSTLRTYLHRDATPAPKRANLLAELLDDDSLADAGPRSRRDRELAELNRRLETVTEAVRRAGLLPPE